MARAAWKPVTGKHDLEGVAQLIAWIHDPEAPESAPALLELLTCVQDVNWPIAHEALPYLRTVGPPLVPLVREVLHSDDTWWAYWCLTNVVAWWDEAWILTLREDLLKIIATPTPAQREDEVWLEAREVLRMLEEGRDG